MGWFWQTPPSSPKPKPAAAAAPAPPAAADGVDPEISKFLAAFQEDVKTDKKPVEPSPQPSKRTDTQTKPAAPPSSSSSSSSSWFSFLSAPAAGSTPSTTETSNPVYPVREPTTQNLLKRAERPSDQPPPPWAPHSSPGAAEISHSLLPKTMSCRQAFDLAFGCQSPAGQWNAVYRHGEARSCNEFWSDFWFCMRTRTWSDEAREEAIRDHYREKEERKYYAPGQPSSEDVWRSRDRKVEPGTAFPMDFSRSVADTKGDEDAKQNLLEIERRRRIRKDLGFDQSTS